MTKEQQILKQHIDEFSQHNGGFASYKHMDIEFKYAILAAITDCLEPYKEAMQEFVDRVDRGEVKSTYTYNKFKKLLNE
jgi:hypothetical protein